MKGDPEEYTNGLKPFVVSRNITLEYDRGIAPATGMSSGGKITLLPDRASADQFAVLAHESAHGSFY
ncbi:MAG TPA: hypothetical protein VEV17_04740 [Bryobacteraceae bacterium]|nr:hypothetical protein [Bryobacteraceae bacterium]